MRHHHPKVHDYTNFYWGHALHNSQPKIKTRWRYLLGFIPFRERWCVITCQGHGGGIREGDYIVYGTAFTDRSVKAKVELIKYYRDPPDMFYAELFPIETSE